ncbi:MAG TPA: helix-turn-helix domain-containing protein [Pirellulales bacterium]|nr:helix-turn-helix domain-containing protein [Pirellulales bacterium]
MPRGHVLPDRDTISILRGEAGLTQQNLASRAGYGVRTISKIESGQPTSSSTLAAIAVVLTEELRRPIHLVDLIAQPHSAARAVPFVAGALIVAENIKLLDLDPACDGVDAASSTATARSVLIDTFRFRYVPPSLQEIDFYYAAAGHAFSGSSLSHPHGAQWRPVERRRKSAAAANGSPDGHLLHIPLAPEAITRPLLVQNEIEYFGAFQQPAHKRFVAPIVFPTDGLTLIVQFPRDRPYGALRGRVRRSPGGPWLPALELPIALAAGRLAYWRVTAPTPGEEYELNWS